MMNSNPMAMIQAFMQFKNQYSGDPKADVMKLLQSGRMSQSQLDKLQNMATQFQRMLGNVR